MNELQKITLQHDFWDHPKDAEKTLKSMKLLKNWTDDFEAVEGSYNDLETLNEFYATGDVSDEEIGAEYARVSKAIEDLEFKKMLSNEEDQLSAVLEINPGAGGTESQDWPRC